jgi:hypothetical protein
MLGWSLQVFAASGRRGSRRCSGRFVARWLRVTPFLSLAHHLADLFDDLPWIEIDLTIPAHRTGYCSVYTTGSPVFTPQTRVVVAGAGQRLRPSSVAAILASEALCDRFVDSLVAAVAATKII